MSQEKRTLRSDTAADSGTDLLKTVSTQLKQAQAEISQLRADLANKDTEIKEFKDTTDKGEKEIIDLQTQVGHLQNDLQILAQNLQDEKDSHALTLEERGRHVETIQSLTRERDQAQQEHSDLKAQYETEAKQVQTFIQTQETELKQAQTALVDKEAAWSASFAHLSGQRTDIENAYQQLETDLREAQSQLAELRATTLLSKGRGKSTLGIAGSGSTAPGILGQPGPSSSPSAPKAPQPVGTGTKPTPLTLFSQGLQQRIAEVIAAREKDPKVTSVPTSSSTSTVTQSSAFGLPTASSRPLGTLTSYSQRQIGTPLIFSTQSTSIEKRASKIQEEEAKKSKN